MEENPQTKIRLKASPETLAAVAGVLPMVIQGVLIHAYRVVQSQSIARLQGIPTVGGKEHALGSAGGELSGYSGFLLIWRVKSPLEDLRNPRRSFFVADQICRPEPHD